MLAPAKIGADMLGLLGLIPADTAAELRVSKSA
jgi:hypothetical protein